MTRTFFLPHLLSNKCSFVLYREPCKLIYKVHLMSVHILHSTTGARFSRARAPSDCERILSFMWQELTSSCSGVDCLRAFMFPATGENWRSIVSPVVPDVSHGVLSCWFAWFSDPESEVFSASEFLRFLFRYSVNNNRTTINPTMVLTPATTRRVDGESAMERRYLFHF